MNSVRKTVITHIQFMHGFYTHLIISKSQFCRANRIFLYSNSILKNKNGKKTNIFACGKPVKYLQCMFLCIVQIMSYTNFSNKLLFAFHVMLFFVSLKKNVVSVRLNQLYDKLEMKIRLQWT